MSTIPADRGGHPNRSDLYDISKDEFPGLKKFQVYDPSGGVNHFHARSMNEGINRIHQSVSNVGVAGRFGYTVHAPDDHPTSPGLQIGGGLMHVTAPHPNDRDQRMRVLHENKPTFNPRLKF